jgi:hypothetical protein
MPERQGYYVMESLTRWGVFITMTSLRRRWHQLLRKYVCSKWGHRWKLSKDGVSYCSRCHAAMR